MEELKNEIDSHLPMIKMDQIDFSKFVEYGDEYFRLNNQSEGKDVTFLLGCQNVQFRTILKDVEKVARKDNQEKQPLSRKTSNGPSTKSNRIKNGQKRRLKEELTVIMSDSKKLMFAIQLMKFAECSELSCKNNSEKYEILSITSPKVTGKDVTGTVLEMMVQKTKLAQITIHKAIVNITDTSIEKIDVNENSLTFLTHIKIANLETHASVTVYFALKTLSLIFGNLSLFSSELAVKREEFDVSALLPRKYLEDEKKMDYTKKYISQLFNFVFKKKMGTKDETKEGNDTKKKLDDLINRLLMLGVTPCTIETMSHVLDFEKIEKVPQISVDNVNPIKTVYTEHEVYQANGNYLRYNLISYYFII